MRVVSLVACAVIGGLITATGCGDDEALRAGVPRAARDAGAGNAPSGTNGDASALNDATSNGALPDASFTRHGPAMGTNLSGMEWARPGLRYGSSTLPNLNFTVPRKADVSYLAANGYTKNRLPIQWELLQPMLHDTNADATAKAAIGNPGEFHAAYASYITDVLDAHAAAGIKVIIDLHNYCRYQDFRYQPDGSVSGLVVPSNPLLRPYTSDGSQVQERICALASGATLTQDNLADFWKRVAQKWKDHPGFGGYGLMNEPHELPQAGATASGGNEDLTIWPTFAQSAIDAIRAVDPGNPIYVSGNEWSSAMSLATKNPGFPLTGNNLVYEVHLYLDASSAGYAFDYDTEVAKGYSAGFGGVPIDLDTGLNRLKLATDWASAKGVKLALTEIGMPLDDERWQTMFSRAVSFASAQDVEVYSWMGGSHWTIHNYPINHAPGWHQNKTLEPTVSGPMKQATGVTLATLFDDGGGHSNGSVPVTITVYARGYLEKPVTLTVASDNGGSFSKTTLTLPAGANGEDSYTFTPKANAVTTLTYASDGALGGQVPPPRKVFSLDDAVAYAATNADDAAMAILAKYKAARWVMADGYTDYLQGAPALAGQPVRAISDSGFGSSVGNALEMLNWTNKDNAASGAMTLPVMGETNGKKYADLRAEGTFGFWCKKAVPTPGVQANPRNRVLYDIEDPHFTLAAVRIATASNSGVVFQASKAEETHVAELTFASGQPQARWIDVNGNTVELTSTEAIAPNVPAVVTMTSKPGAQALRVDSVQVASNGGAFAPSAFNQMLIGSGFVSYYPRPGFGGDVYAVITGKGAPTLGELGVLEKHLAKLAGR